MTIHDVPVILAREALLKHLDVESALALMVLLHTHRVCLSDVQLTDRPGITKLGAITQRHAADVLAAAWPDRSDSARTDYSYWYFQFNTRVPFEVLEDVPQEWLTRVNQLRGTIADLPIVDAIEPDA